MEFLDEVARRQELGGRLLVGVEKCREVDPSDHAVPKEAEAKPLVEREDDNGAVFMHFKELADVLGTDPGWPMSP